MTKITKGKGQYFVRLTWKMLEHNAYIDLPASARAMLPYFLKKVKISDWEPVYYNTQFTFCYTEADKYGCAKRTFFRVIEALVKNGFVDPVKRGGLRGTGLTSSIFKLSDRWKRYGTHEFQEVSWSQFGQIQIQHQGHKWQRRVAKNELEKNVKDA